MSPYAGDSWFQVLDTADIAPFPFSQAPTESPLSNGTPPTNYPEVPTEMPYPETPAVPSTPTDWRQSMDGIARDAVNNLHLAGLTLAIRRPGKPDWIRAYGYADLHKAIPASLDTVYQIGLLSMQFTAAAILQQVELGRLDLYAPVSQYLPGLPPDMQVLTLH
jgi:CubicO group peptidase (beta-lactamase class C family)